MDAHATLPLKFERIAVERTLPLRHEVLWPDMPIDKVKLPEDQNGWHFGAFMDNPLANDDPIAVISLFLDPIPIDHVAAHSACGSSAFWDNGSITGPSEIITVRFRKFACKTTMQGQGVGTALFKHAMHFAHSELKAEVFWCDARVSSVAWYSGRGLSQFGHKFYKGAVDLRWVDEIDNTAQNRRRMPIWTELYNGRIRSKGDVRKVNVMNSSHEGPCRDEGLDFVFWIWIE